MEPVKYQLSKHEFVLATANRFLLRKKNIIAQTVLFMMAVIWWIMEIPPVEVAFIIILIPVFLPIFMFFRINKIVKSNPNLFVSEITLLADNNGIKSTSSVVSSALNWSAFKKWTETKKYIFIYLADFQAMTVPKRAFTNEQLMEFKALLAEKIRPS